jgi:peroxiredoxin
MKYIKSILLTSIIFFGATLFVGCGGEDPTPIINMGNGNPGGNPSEPFGKAPDFNLTSVDGGQVQLKDFEGKPLVIFFLGSTCPLCISSAPSIESGINQKFSSSVMNIIGVDTWDGNQAAVENFRNTTGVTFDLLLNASALQNSYNTTYDRLLVVDSNGEIVFKGTSTASSDVDEVVALINKLME